MTREQTDLFDINIAIIAQTRSKLANRFLQAKEKNPAQDITEAMDMFQKIADFETLLRCLIENWAKALKEAEESNKWNDRASNTIREQQGEIAKLKQVIENLK